MEGPVSQALSRPDPVGLLEEQAASRVSELIPVRRGRMMVSPFTFYRGAARAIAADGRRCVPPAWHVMKSQNESSRKVIT